MGARIRRQRRGAGVIAIGIVLGWSGFGLFIPTSAAASASSPCHTPIYSGHWSGTWVEQVPGGPSGPPPQPASGSWSADVTVSIADVVTGSFSMAQTNPSPSPLFTSEVLAGTVSCQSNQIHVDFHGINNYFQLDGPLSSDGLSSFGTYQFANNQGTFQGNAPAPSQSTLISCASPQACNPAVRASASVTAPGLSLTVAGTPAAGAGTVQLTIAPGKLACPKLVPTVRPVADLTDAGFAPSDRLKVTATVPLFSSSTAEQVCFSSTVPFKSRSNPTAAKAGTAFLLDCSKVANVAPCVMSSKQVGSNVLVQFVVPGGDPTFTIDVPSGRQLWLSQYGTGKVGAAFDARFQTRGGLAPFHWSVASGKLPAGCTLSATTGTITGTPTVKGTYKIVMQAKDSERPQKIATLPVPITIT